MEKTNEVTEQVEWNMAALLNGELARLRTHANSNYIKGNYRTAVEALRAIKMTAVYAFAINERNELENLELQFDYLLPIITNYNDLNEDERISSSNAFLKFRPLYHKYNALLQDLLDKYGFLGGRKKDASKMVFKR